MERSAEEAETHHRSPGAAVICRLPPTSRSSSAARDPTIAAATGRLRAKLGREPSEEETLEEALKAELAKMSRRATGCGPRCF